MNIPFLFTIVLCALAQVVSGYTIQMTDLIPLEKRVQVQALANGIKVYLHDTERSSRLSSLRVVMRHPSNNEVSYAYDGKIESVDQVEEFFTYCKEKSEGNQFLLDDWGYSSSKLPSVYLGAPHEMAVIAVGDFSKDQMLMLIQRHFGEMFIGQGCPFSEISQSIYIDSHPKNNRVALSVSFPNLSRSICTYDDLKETWKYLMLQEMYQMRQEISSKVFEEPWIHPHPHFFYPVNGYSYVAEEVSENLLAYFLWQIEAMKSDGFSEEEFLVTKHQLIDQLQYLVSSAVNPDNVFLASYYKDQFLLGNNCLCYEDFLNASLELIQGIEYEDLASHINTFLAENRRSIQVVYPELLYNHALTVERIEGICQQVVSLASCYRESGRLDDEGDWVLDIKNLLATNSKNVPIESKKNTKNPVASIVLANNPEPAQFCFAENAPIVPIADPFDLTEPYFQLPINDKEKRLIRSIFTTMAEKNIIQLALEKRTMERKGKKINHLHPLRFIGYIFSNPDLKSCMRKIVKSSFKWDAFVDGFSRRMKEEHSNNNLSRHVPGFCKEVGANHDEIMRYVDKRDWEGLVKSLI